MVHIIDQRGTYFCNYGEIEIGDYFCYDGTYFIKTNIEDSDKDYDYYALNLLNGVRYAFKSDVEVEVLTNIEVIVK